MEDDGVVTRRSLLQGSAAVAGAVIAGVHLADEASAAPTQPIGAARQHRRATTRLQVGDPPTVQDTESSLYAATNTSFGTASVSGSYSDCAVVFTAPASGRVLVHWSGGVRNLDADGSAVAYLSPEVRTGGTVGSGTVVLAADNARTVRTNLGGSHTVRAGATHLLTGLSSGATYNARLLHRVTSNTGEFFQRGLVVAPTS